MGHVKNVARSGQRLRDRTLRDASEHQSHKPTEEFRAMTKKDYVAIANSVACERKHWVAQMNTPNASWAQTACDSEAAIGSIARTLANLFASDNPNFDCARFLKACGVAQ